MKVFKFILVFTLMALFTINGQAQTSQITSNKVETLKGEKVDILDYIEKGHITVISFWATWCSPCKKELEAMTDFYPDWKSDYGVNFIAVSIDNARSTAKVNGTVEQKGWEYTILLDKNQQFIQKISGFSSVPYTVLIDQDGNIVYNHSGYVPGDEYELEDHIKELAKK